MLDEMKEAGRSDHSATVVKKKSSSGCLIIKKKVADSGGGARGFSESSSRNLCNSSKEKKRPRVVGSDSEFSEDSSETIRQKVDKFRNGSVVKKGAYLQNREFERDKRLSNGLDVFEFDEYDGFDVNDGRYGLKLYGSGGSRMIVDKRRDFHHATESSRSTYGTTNWFEMEDNESNLPLSVLSEKNRISSNEPIRLQGKNGVLKVMVNKNKKKLSVSNKNSDHSNDGDGQSLRSEDANKNKAVMNASRYSDFNCPGKPDASKKCQLKFLKPVSAKSSKEANDSHTSLQLKSFSRGKLVISEGNVNTPTENVTRVKGKERKVKRGSGTEKQLLREKIKSMLLAAGWTIDYRPRRNRDYLDAVYISPAGTAYWSIIKAYEALQKEEEEDSEAGGSFTPLPDEILGKLTRQTRKKIEREMKKKRKNEGSSRNAKRARVEEDGDGDSSDNLYKEMSKYNSAAKTIVGRNSHIVHGTNSRKIARCTLLVRSSNKGLNSENDGFVPYLGKRTILSWLIDSGTVHMSEHVQYMNRRKTRIMQKGWITKDGIHCSCCSKILSVLKFELHAGSKLRQPFPNIFLQSGKSLMQCQIDAWNKQGELERKGFYTVDVDGDDPNDDTCGLCGDGGDLICCDGCPSTFHQSCLDIQMLPQGDWHCPNCSCKYCEIAVGNGTEVGDKTETSLLVCRLCEKKYHESCKPEIDVKSIGSINADLFFCGQKCGELYSRLQKLHGVKHLLGSGCSWSLFHRSDMSDASSVELPQRVECNSMLAVAMSVMDECFLPAADRRSGINLIRNVVFSCGSNLSRLNYSGFFTAIMERGDEVLCAASIRIHGTQLAEMPFIGTRHIYRRQGMCRRLLSAIESALSSLQVEKLIIPAIAEHMNTWTDVFAFHPLEESHKQELRSMNTLVFPGTDMLQKALVRQGKNTIEVEGNKALPKKSELISSSIKEFGVKICIAEVDSQESKGHLDDGCSVDTSSETDAINSPVKDEEMHVQNKSVSSGGLDTSMQNGGTNKALPKSSKFICSDVKEFGAEESSGPLDDGCSVDAYNETPTVNSHSSGGINLNAGDGTSVQNGDSSKDKFDPLVAQVTDVASQDIQLSISVNAHLDSNLQEFRVEEGNEGTIPLSDAASDMLGKEYVLTDSLEEEIGVQNGDVRDADVPCESQLRLSGKESVSCVEKIHVQNGSQTESTNHVISLQTEAPNVPVNDNAVSSDTACEDAHIAAGVEKSSADVGPVILETGKLAGVQFSGDIRSHSDLPGTEEMVT